MKIGLIDIGISNIKSVINALASINYTPILIQNHKIWNETAPFDKIIFPGVGHYDSAYTLLHTSQLIPLIKQYINQKGYFLGICIGLQILFEGSEEKPNKKGLSIFPGYIVKIKPNNINEKIPHNGWNSVNWTGNTALNRKIPNHADFYFNHSFATNTKEEFAIGHTPYGNKGIISAVKKDNIYGVQFHPEKSQTYGLQLLKNFIEQ